MIVINRTGYQRNPARVNNANNEIKYELTSKRRVYELLTPIPLDVSYEVSIVAKYPSPINALLSPFKRFVAASYIDLKSDTGVLFVTSAHESLKINPEIRM